MTNLIISTLGFIFWSITIIFIYYSKSFSDIDHIETTTHFGGYLITMVIIYSIYKGVSLSLGWKKLSFSFFTIFGLALFHIFIVSVIYSGFPEVGQSPFMQNSGANGITLFIHICSLLFYPLILVFLMRSFGLSFALLMLKDKWREIDIRLRIPAEITLGFAFFVVGLLVIGSIQAYTLPGLLALLVILGIAGYRGHRETYTDIRTRKIEIENHNDSRGLESQLNLKLLSIEFGFIFLTFLPFCLTD